MNMFKVLFPTVFKAVTGNIPGAIGEVGKIFGVDIDSSSEASLDDFIKKASPDQLFKLKEFENRSQELDNERLAIVTADIDSARKMNIHNNGRFMNVFSFLIIAGQFSLLLVLMKFPIPVKNEAIIYGSLGGITAMAMNVVAFYFGSSLGSKEKNGIISTMKSFR